MAELVPFAVPTGNDKTLLVWELSPGPTAEALHVSRARVEGGMGKAAPSGDQDFRSPAVVLPAERSQFWRDPQQSGGPGGFLRGNSQQHMLPSNASRILGFQRKKRLFMKEVF